MRRTSRSGRSRSFLLPCSALALLSCNTPLPSDTLPDPAELGPQALAVTDIPPTVVAASAQIATDQAPFSLTTSDGAGLLLTKIDAKAVIDGPLAFTELHLSFRNPESRVREGRFTVTLPDDAALSRFAMQIDGQWMEAEVVPKMIARRAYEDFLHRRQDPALLEKADGNEFSARVFPIPANGEKHLVLSYSQELRDDDYALPLRGLAAVGAIDASVRVVDQQGNVKTATLSHKQWKPDRDFTVAVPASAAISAGGLIVARTTVELPSAADPVSDALILVDSSASRALGYRQQARDVRALVAALAKQGDPSIEIAAFDQETVSLYHGKASAFGDAAERTLASREPLGASDLGQALAWAKGKAKLRRRVILVTDAMATAGAESAALATAARDVGAQRLDVVLAGGIRDAALAAALTQAGLPRAGAVLDLARGPAEVARRLALATQTQIPVSVAGATWSWPTSLPAAQPGDRVVVFAKVANPGPVELRLGASKVSLSPRPVTGPLVQRAGARALIAELEARIAAEQDATRKQTLRTQLSELSVKHRVLSSETAMLVLETEEDYVRYKIPRSSLADILVVGPRGVELSQRKGPVLMAAEEKPRPKPSERPVKKSVARGDDGDGLVVEQVTVGAIGSEAGAGSIGAGAGAGSAAAGPGDDFAKEEAELDGAFEGRGEIVPVTGNSREERESRRAPAAEPPPPPPMAAPRVESLSDERLERRQRVSPSADRNDPLAMDSKSRGPAPLTGELAEIMGALEQKKADLALKRAWAWRHRDYGDVLALIGLGESLEAKGDRAQAARAYGSIIDLFPARADLRRFAGQRLERLGAAARPLVLDTYRRALADRPDHLTGYRLLAFAQVRDGKLAEAFATVEQGLRQSYPGGRFAGGDRILREDAGLIAAAWLKQDPKRRAELMPRLAALGASLATAPSTRFVLYWETDSNDVDFHIRDARGGHAYYQSMNLPSGGSLYQDVTTGYGPECFTIPGVPSAGPYSLSINYYSQGPMGYGMGLLEVVAHDGKGGLTFDARPYVVMVPSSFVELGSIGGRGSAQIAK
jgi:Vault protein inter-alpha-trypsin domain/von Willebrand factor type A domain